MRLPPSIELFIDHYRDGVSAIQWPLEDLVNEGPPRGFVLFDGQLCTACGECIGVCPSGCLELPEGDEVPFVDVGGCVLCGLCVTTCPEIAVSLTGRDTVATRDRSDLVMDGGLPAEEEVGPPPRRLVRLALGVEPQAQVRPRDLLAKRAKTLGLDDELPD